ncbi:MAG: HDOD domain-containing protein [Candidatus Coatesbacteria bacterium]|nr:HDOD domain-containing protein [Candidatus Coatesbacteria bacterium]
MTSSSARSASEVKLVLKRLSELPTLPAALYRMLDVLSDPKLSMAAISKIIAEDPSLTSKMLKLANSPYYGFQKEVRSVDHAMVLLGVETVKALALGVSIFNTFHDSVNMNGIDKAGLWAHFLAVAFCSREFSLIMNSVEPNSAFTGGLIHDIGRLALLRMFPSESVLVVGQTEQGGCSLLDAERDIYGIDHEEAGAFLAKTWGLPEDLQEAIAFHHDMSAFEKTELVHAVYMAERLCKLLELGWTGEPKPDDMRDEELRAAGIDRAQLDEVRDRILAREPEIKEFLKRLW